MWPPLTKSGKRSPSIQSPTTIRLGDKSTRLGQRKIQIIRRAGTQQARTRSWRCHPCRHSPHRSQSICPTVITVAQYCRLGFRCLRRRRTCSSTSCSSLHSRNLCSSSRVRSRTTWRLTTSKGWLCRPLRRSLLEMCNSLAQRRFQRPSLMRRHRRCIMRMACRALPDTAPGRGHCCRTHEGALLNSCA
jgi:hypothetical protein